MLVARAAEFQPHIVIAVQLNLRALDNFAYIVEYAQQSCERSNNNELILIGLVFHNMYRISNQAIS